MPMWPERWPQACPESVWSGSAALPGVCVATARAAVHLLFLWLCVSVLPSVLHRPVCMCALCVHMGCSCPCMCTRIHLWAST